MRQLWNQAGSLQLNVGILHLISDLAFRLYPWKLLPTHSQVAETAFTFTSLVLLSLFVDLQTKSKSLQNSLFLEHSLLVNDMPFPVGEALNESHRLKGFRQVPGLSAPGNKTEWLKGLLNYKGAGKLFIVLLWTIPFSLRSKKKVFLKCIAFKTESFILKIKTCLNILADIFRTLLLHLSRRSCYLKDFKNR